MYLMIISAKSDYDSEPSFKEAVRLEKLNQLLTKVEELKEWYLQIYDNFRFIILLEESLEEVGRGDNNYHELKTVCPRCGNLHYLSSWYIGDDKAQTLCYLCFNEEDSLERVHRADAKKKQEIAIKQYRHKSKILFVDMLETQGISTDVDYFCDIDVMDFYDEVVRPELGNCPYGLRNWDKDMQEVAKELCLA